MHFLIVGGTSGLGLELAKMLKGRHTVTVTGRKDPMEGEVEFRKLDLSCLSILEAQQLVADLPRVDVCIYAAGFYQQCTVTDLQPRQVHEMLNVSMVAPVFLVRSLLLKQGQLPGLIAITSTSEWTPRANEPLYAASKAGLAMLANSLACDPRVGKVMVAGPAGMVTSFWDGTGKDTAGMLSATWVASVIVNYWSLVFSYKHIQILRDPARVKTTETRP